MKLTNEAALAYVHSILTEAYGSSGYVILATADGEFEGIDVSFRRADHAHVFTFNVWMQYGEVYGEW